jgi:radical SAM superfamily enzyme YgiQ (UPF0313 family)
MNILLLSPHYPDTYWSFRHALKFVSKKASNPPLGLLTLSSMLPLDWNRKLVDLNVHSLKDADILWADYVFIGAMSVQASSANEVIQRCKKLDAKIVGGGPLFTGDPESYLHLDHLVLNEAEICFPDFLKDLKNNKPKKMYRSSGYADMELSPPPDYSLIRASHYAQLSIQYSRGCPHSCEFCEITALLGHKVRVKSSDQILVELSNIYHTGFRGNVFFVDDNFIGNKYLLKKSLLPEVARWNKEHKYPFVFTTEASIDLAGDQQLMKQMVEAGFEKVFVGIESPEELSLQECNKTLNIKHELLDSIKLIHAAGIEVSAGFIVGFDSDTPSIFQRQIDFIQESGIITAMVGLLNAPNRTRLYQRLKKEGRLLARSGGDNTDFTMNFIPKMNKDLLLNGYKHILNGIYSSKAYYIRLKEFLRTFHPGTKIKNRLDRNKILALLRSVVYIGLLSKGRRYYWKLFWWSLLRKPKMFPMAITYSIYGYHFRKVYGISSYTS